MEVIKAGTQGVSWFWSLVNDTRTRASGSCIIWTSPWTLINGVLVTYKNLPHLLQNFALSYQLSQLQLFPGFFWSKQTGSEQPKKLRELICANLSCVEMIREWSCKQLDEFEECWPALWLCVGKDMSSAERWLLAEDAHTQPVMSLLCICGLRRRVHTDDHPTAVLHVASLSWLAEKLRCHRSECGSRKAKQLSWLHTWRQTAALVGRDKNSTALLLLFCETTSYRHNGRCAFPQMQLLPK